MPASPFIGRYINLDRSAERRAVLEAQLSAHGRLGRYERFAAVDGVVHAPPGSSLSPGEIGCFLSHYECLRQAPRDAPLHIIEDDVVFGPRCFLMLDQVIDQALEHFEVVFTDIFVTANLATLRRLMQQYGWAGMLERREGEAERTPRSITFFDLRGHSFAGTSSYFVRPDARDKLIAVLQEQLAAGPTTPIDFVYREAINSGRISAGCTTPFLSTVSAASVNASTVRGSADTRSALASFLTRYYFYLDRTDDFVAEAVADLTGGLTDPHYADPLLAAISFMLSDGFAVF